MKRLALLVLPAALTCVGARAAQDSADTYRDARELLSRMKGYDLRPETLAAVFRVGDARIEDLVRALDDPDREVSLNAQRAIRYLGNEAGLKGLDEYYRRQPKERVFTGPVPVPLLEADYDVVKSDPSNARESHIYALAIEGSARAGELPASIARLNAPQGSMTAHALASLKADDPNKLLKGSSDVAALVLKHAFFVGEYDKKYTSARLVGFNGAKDKALVEVYIGRGPLAEEWWHVVVSRRDGGWRFCSVTQVGVS